MITDLIVELVAGIIKGTLGMLFGLIPSPPGWAVSGLELLAQAYGITLTFSTWLPVNLALSIAGGVLVTYVIALIIGVIRVIVSYLTFGGGGT